MFNIIQPCCMHVFTDNEETKADNAEMGKLN